jgi:ABC-type multidrug transport system permease subunit
MSKRSGETPSGAAGAGTSLAFPAMAGPAAALLTFAALCRESWIVARYSALTFFRYRAWFMNLALGPFLTMAPLVFLADTLLGRGAPLRGEFFEGNEFTDYVGFLVVPMIAVGLTNTIFSWIGGLIRMERNVGTLERLLVSLRFPSSLLFGRALAHALFITMFTLVTLVLIAIWLKPDYHVNPVSAALIVVLHIAVTYGTAFALSSILLRLDDAFFFQSFVSKAMLSILAGATFPLAIFPFWLQVISRFVPFTWAFELERAALLRAEPVSDLVPGLMVLGAMTLGVWVLGFLMLNRELNAARRTGVLGRY